MYREALAEHPIDAGLRARRAVRRQRGAPGARGVAHPRDRDGRAVGLYDADDFERMVAEQRPDVVIVTTPDYLHDAYIVRALRAGCDVDHREADDDRPRAG